MIKLIERAIRKNFMISRFATKPLLCDIYTEDGKLYEEHPFAAIVVFIGLCDKYGVQGEEIENFLCIEPKQRLELLRTYNDIIYKRHVKPGDYRVFEGNYEGNKKWNIEYFHRKNQLVNNSIQMQTNKFSDAYRRLLKKKEESKKLFNPENIKKLKDLTFNNEKI
jgi:hypothetical protein